MACPNLLFSVACAAGGFTNDEPTKILLTLTGHCGAPPSCTELNCLQMQIVLYLMGLAVLDRPKFDEFFIN